MKSPRILILTNRVPYPLNDGGALGMEVFIKGFPEAGCTTRLLAMNTSRHRVQEEVLPAVWPQLDAIVTVPVDNNIHPLPLLRNWLFGSAPYHLERFSHASFYEALRVQLAAFQPTVVHIESPFLAGCIPIIRKEAPDAVIAYRMNNVEAEIWQRLAQTEPNPLKRRYLKNLSRRMRRFEEKHWPQFDVVLPVTHEDAAVAARFVSESRIRVVPFCIDLAQYDHQLWPEKRSAYHLAAMDWLPNAEAVNWFIQQVWPLMKEQLPVYFAGRHMPESILEKAAGMLHIQGEVGDAKTFMADKPILLVPLKSGGGIRVKILEAMAAGKLVVSTTVGMQGIPVENSVHALIADTPEAFADALLYAHNHPEESQKMAQAGFAFVQNHFNRKVLMQQLVQWLAMKAPHR